VGKLVGLAVSIWNLPNKERYYRELSYELARRIEITNRDLAQLSSASYGAFRILERSQNLQVRYNNTLVTNAHLVAHYSSRKEINQLADSLEKVSNATIQLDAAVRQVNDLIREKN
jgi:hypothetical protein